MRLTVFGASGGVGQRVVRLALERQHVVRAVYRRAPTDVPADGIERLVGEITDPVLLARAIDGADVVVSAVGIRRVNPNNPWSALASPRTLTEDFVRVLIAAIRRVPGLAPRIVFVSAAGVGASASILTFPVRTMFRWSQIGVAYADLERAESLLAASGLDFSVIRPTTLTNGRPAARLVVPRRYGLLQSIPRESVARWIVDRAESNRPGERFTVLTAR